MTNWAALDVAIGIVVVFFLLSLIVSTLNEAIATAPGWRAHFLERWLRNVLVDPGTTAREADEASQAFYGHPLLAPLLTQRHWSGKAKAKERKPSYIPRDVFSAVLFNADPQEKAVAQTLDDAIAALPSPQLRKIVTTLRQEVGDDGKELRRRLERWYDDSMARISGWYKRRIQIALAVIGLVVAIALNVDTLQIARTLWMDKTVRAAIVAEAGRVTQQGRPTQDLKAVADQVQEIRSLNIPLGWKLKASDPRDIPHSPGLWVAKVLGILLTMLATMLGAPFWFDLLGRIMKLRGSGAPPAVGDPSRSGSAV